MAVVTHSWQEHGRIEVWDVRSGTRMARLEGAPLIYTNDTVERWVAFTPGGGRLAALGKDRRVQWWRVDDEHRDGHTRPLTEASGLLGMAPDGTLVTLLVDDIGLFSATDGEPLGRFEWAGALSIRTARLVGDTLRLVSDKDNQSLQLSPTHWHRVLCSAAPGPYTPAQRTAPRLRLARETRPCPHD